MAPEAAKGNSSREMEDILYLVAPGTVVEAAGKSAPLELGTLAGRPLLVVLRITQIIEQESADVAVWGSADGKDWGTSPLFSYPQKFYRDITPAAVDLSQRPDVRFLEARWSVNRWGRGYPRPHFVFSVGIQALRP